MTIDRSHLLCIVGVEISSATNDIDQAILQRRWRDYCRQLQECLKNATEEDLPKIAEKHFRLAVPGYAHDLDENRPATIRRQGMFASYLKWSTPTEDQRVTDVVLAVRSGEIPYKKLMEALQAMAVSPAFFAETPEESK